MGASSVRTARNRACIHQGWLCYYCGLTMLTSRSDRAEKMPGLSCSAEHLVARCNDGGNQASNIVAAHVVCNQRRHKRGRDLAPEAYQAMVRSRIAKGRWHPEAVFRCLEGVRR